MKNLIIQISLCLTVIACTTIEQVVNPTDLLTSLNQQFDESLAKQDYKLALHTAGRLYLHNLIDQNEYHEYINSLVPENFENIQMSLNNLISSKYYLNKNSLPVVNEGISVDRAINATVTIRIHKGTSFHGNIGYPDIVIGSGFFITDTGYILTNYHVIESEVDPTYEGRSDLYIYLNGDDSTKVPAKVVGFNKDFDIALIKTEIDPPAYIPYNPQFDLFPGDRILAVGSPGGLRNSVSAGILSSKSRQLMSLGAVYQIDVPINPGNSGGPLLTEDGYLAGLVFAGIEQFEGVNFAIPMEYVDLILPFLFNEQEFKFPWLGISLLTTNEGLKVIYVAPDSPAKHLQIMNGDILLGINGESFLDPIDAQKWILRQDQNTVVKIDIKRDETIHTLYASLGSRPDEPIDEGLKHYTFDKMIPVMLGMDVELLGKNFLGQSEYRINEIYPGRLADENGFSKDDFLVIERVMFNEDKTIILLQLTVRLRSEGFIEQRIALGIPIFSKWHI